jgi:hypothetical protein
MLPYLIKVTNNSLSTVLAMSLLLAVLYRSEPGGKKTYLAWGAAIGAAAALIYAVLKRTTGFAVREYYDLGVLLPSIVASIGLSLAFLFALFTSFTLTRRIFTSSKAYRFVLHFFALWLVAGWTAYTLPDLLLYPFEFAVGMDTIFNTDFMYKAIGYLLALLILFLVGVAYFSTASSDKLPSRLVFPTLTLSIVVMVAFEAMTVTQILLGRNMIPRYKWLMGPLMWLLPRVDGFMYALMALAVGLCVALFMRVKSAAPEGENPAQRR